MVSNPWAMSAATVASAVVIEVVIEAGVDVVAAVIGAGRFRSGLWLGANGGKPECADRRQRVESAQRRPSARQVPRALTSGPLHVPFRATFTGPDQHHAPLSLPYLRRAARSRYRHSGAAFRLVPPYPRPRRPPVHRSA